MNINLVAMLGMAISPGLPLEVVPLTERK